MSTNSPQPSPQLSSNHPHDAESLIKPSLRPHGPGSALHGLTHFLLPFLFFVLFLVSGTCLLIFTFNDHPSKPIPKHALIGVSITFAILIVLQFFFMLVIHLHRQWKKKQIWERRVDSLGVQGWRAVQLLDSRSGSLTSGPTWWRKLRKWLMEPTAVYPVQTTTTGKAGTQNPPPTVQTEPTGNNQDNQAVNSETRHPQTQAAPESRTMPAPWPAAEQQRALPPSSQHREPQTPNGNRRPKREAAPPIHPPHTQHRRYQGLRHPAAKSSTLRGDALTAQHPSPTTHRRQSAASEEIARNLLRSPPPVMSGAAGGGSTRPTQQPQPQPQRPAAGTRTSHHNARDSVMSGDTGGSQQQPVVSGVTGPSIHRTARDELPSMRGAMRLNQALPPVPAESEGRRDSQARGQGQGQRYSMPVEENGMVVRGGLGDGRGAVLEVEERRISGVVGDAEIYGYYTGEHYWPRIEEEYEGYGEEEEEDEEEGRGGRD